MKNVEIHSQNDVAPVPVLIALGCFYCVFSAAVAIVLFYFRHFLGGPGAGVFFLYWLELVVLAAAIVLGTRRYLEWFIAALGLFLILGAFHFLTPYVVGPLGAVALTALFVPFWSCWRSTLAPGAAAILLSGIYFLTFNGLGYANLLVPERMLVGLAYPDTLFHTALASTLSNYGVLASALDGLVRIHYHAFSHLWLGLVAKSVGLNAVHGYYLGLQIIALPLLLLGLGLATSTFSKVRHGTALLIVVPLSILFCLDRFDSMSYLGSESHMVGLLLLLTGMPHLRALADGPNESADRAGLVALSFAILLSAAKISVGMTWTVAAVFLLLRGRRLSLWGALASGFLLVLHAYIVVEYVLPDDNVSTTSFDPLDFIRTFPLIAAANLVLVVLAAVFHIRDWRTARDRTWHEAVLLMLLVNMLPTLLLRMEGGSAYYFLDIATWISIASLAARFLDCAALYSARLVQAGAVGIMVVMSILTAEKRQAYGALKYEREAIYNQLDRRASVPFVHTNLFSPRALTMLKNEAAASPAMAIAGLLQKDGVTPGSDVLVAVSPSFKAFWTLTPQCNAAPFLVPAYFGVPLLNGLPPELEHCELGSYYGYRQFGRESQARTLDNAALCRLAVSKGFHHTEILESATRSRRLDCPGSR